MAKRDEPKRNARYEFRVWGQHKRARKLLAELAESSVEETIEDCYFLLDEMDVNAKVRSDTFKIKELVGRAKGFERWVSRRHQSLETVPEPFREILEDLRLDHAGRKSYDLARQVEALDPEHPATPVLVTKRRIRYQVGSSRAEVTDIVIDATGDVLHTLAIEGDDLDELTALRKRLRLKGESNMAVHVAIDAAL